MRSALTVTLLFSALSWPVSAAAPTATPAALLARVPELQPAKLQCDYPALLKEVDVRSNAVLQGGDDEETDLPEANVSEDDEDLSEEELAAKMMEQAQSLYQQGKVDTSALSMSVGIMKRSANLAQDRKAGACRDDVNERTREVEALPEQFDGAEARWDRAADREIEARCPVVDNHSEAGPYPEPKCADAIKQTYRAKARAESGRWLAGKIKDLGGLRKKLDSCARHRETVWTKLRASGGPLAGTASAMESDTWLMVENFIKAQATICEAFKR